MKVLFSAIAAFAFLVIPAAADGYNWSGVYLGAHAGYASGNMDVVDTDGGVPYGAFNYDPKGAFGGGTVGANWQAGVLVLGVESDLGFLNLNGDRFIASSSPGYHQNATLDGGLYGDATGRVGIAFGRALVYGKGGFAFYDGEAIQATTKPWYTPTGTDMFTGWTYGGGLEYALGDCWSLKAEFLHFDFGSQGGVQEKTSSVGADDPGTPVGYKFHNEHTLDADTIKIGVSYHLGGGDSYPLK